MEFSKEDIRKIMYYCYKRGLSPPEMSKEICSVFGDDITCPRTCQRWVSKFQNGNFVTKSAEGAGRPSLELEDQINFCFEEDAHSTTRSIAQSLDTSHQTVWRHMKHMDMRYLANKWVPHKLSTENKNNRGRICGELLAMHRNNDFLNQLVTGDELWLF